MKKFLLLFLCFSLFINNLLLVFAADEEVEEELFVDGTQINAITDYSTYGAADVTEMSSVSYLDKNRFTDIKDSELLRRVSLLSALGIMNGTGEGLFSPESDFTRIQFVLTALRMMNFDAKSHDGSGVEFYDLGDDYEYLPEIESAVDLGIITGFSDKTLRPDEPVSYTDALTIMLRIMGYTTEAYSKGGYPNGFLQVASKLKLDDGITLSESDSFTRADAATLLYNCLHTDVYWTAEFGDSGFQANSMGTMLEAYFDIYISTGTIEATYLAAIDDSPEAEDDTVIIGGEKYYCNKYSYSEYLGKCADVYYTFANGSKKSIRHLELCNDEKELIIKSDDIVDFDDYTLRYYDKNKLKTVDIDVGHNLIYNGKRKVSYDDSIFVPENGFVRLLRTCDYSGSKYNVVFVNEYFNFHVQSLTANDSILKFAPKGNSSGMLIDLAKPEFLMEIYDKNGMMSSDLSVVDSYDNDGNLIKKYLVPPIPSNSLISVFTDDVADGINGRKTVGENAAYLKIYINDAKVEGSVEAQNLNNNMLVINSNEFKFSDDNFLFDEDAVTIGTTGTFLFDFNGKIAALNQSSSGDEFIYGYLINAIGEGSLNPKYRFQILKSNGSIEIFEGVEIKSLRLNGSKVDSADKLAESLAYSAKLLDPTFTISQVIKYKLNEEGKVKELQTVTASTGVADGYESNHLNRHAPRAAYTTPRYYGGALYSTDGDIVVEGRKLARYSKSGFYFIVPDAETFDEDDYAVKPDTHYFSAATQADLFNCDEGLSPDVAVLYSQTELSENDPPFIVVDMKVKVLDEDGMSVTAVRGVDGYKESDFLEGKEGVFSSAESGDIFFCKGADKEIEEAEKIFSVYDVADHDYESTEYIAKTIAGDSETMYCTPMEIYDYSASTRSFVLQIGPDDDGDGKRALQRVSYWSNLATTFRYGCVTCNIYERDIELKAGSANDIRTAREFGHEQSTKILLVESGNLRYFVLVNDYR